MKGISNIAIAGLVVVGLLGSSTIANAGTDKYKGSKKSSKKKSSGSTNGFVGSNSATSGAETGLAGIKIYDSGLRVIALYGNPDSISAINVGGTAATGGGDGPPGGFGGRGGGGGGGGAPGSAQRPSLDQITPLPSDVLGNGSLWSPVDARRQQDSAPSSSAPGSPPPGAGGPGGGGRFGGGGDGGAAPGAGANTASESTVFTRWNYTKNGTKLGFVIDKFNRVLQIEAIALENKAVQTRRGVGFGSTFSTVMKRYAPSNDPDGYDLAGNNFTVRFLTRTRVAFRLTQLAAKTPHVVTGIVVSAGKQ